MVVKSASNVNKKVRNRSLVVKHVYLTEDVGSHSFHMTFLSIIHAAKCGDVF